MKINVERNKWNRPSNQFKSVNYYCGHKKNEKEINARLSLCDKYTQENDIIKLKKTLDELIELGKKIKDEKMEKEKISQNLKNGYKKYKKKLNEIIENKEKEKNKFLENKEDFVERVVDFFDGELI